MTDTHEIPLADGSFARSLSIKDIEVREPWDKFMATQKPHTFLHSWLWGEFNVQMGSRIFRLGVFDGVKLVAVALILKIQARRGSFFFCPHGPIMDGDVEIAEVLGVLTEHLKVLAKTERCAFIRFSPLLIQTPAHQAIFKKLKYREAPIHMQHPELSWLLDLSLSEDDLLKNMRKTTRYCIKKAQKDGVEVTMSSVAADTEHFWEIYQATVGRQNFTPFPKEYMRREMEVFGKEHSAAFFFAKYNHEIVATALIVFVGDSAFYHHGASIHKYPKITAPYLLQWAVIQEAKRRGCHFYNFWGVVPEDQTNHPWAGLSLFKRGFGGVEEQYLHAKDLATSPKYWLSYAVETIRRKKRRL